MQQKSSIDMSRPLALYFGGVGIVVLVSLLISNVPELAISSFFDFPYRKKVSAGLFLLGALAGAWAVLNHSNRLRSPWRFSQATVLWPFIVALISTLLALTLSR